MNGYDYMFIYGQEDVILGCMVTLKLIQRFLMRKYFGFSLITASSSASVAGIRQHSSLQVLPDLSNCIMVPDDNGVYHLHKVIQGNMPHMKLLVGPRIIVQGTSTPVSPSVIAAFGGSSGSIGSAGSSAFSGSASSVASQSSQSSTGSGSIG